jgi:hypothetical protein
MMIPGTAFAKRMALALSLAALVSSAPSPTKEAIAPATLDVRAQAPRNVTEVGERDLPGNGADCSMYWDPDWSGYGWTGMQLQ